MPGGQEICKPTSALEFSVEESAGKDGRYQAQAGKPNARLNPGKACKRADALQARLEKRMEDLKLGRQVSPLPPVVLGAVAKNNRIETPESGHGRTVDMSEQLATALRRLQIERKTETLRRGSADVPVWVFCPDAGTPFRSRTLPPCTTERLAVSGRD